MLVPGGLTLLIAVLGPEAVARATHPGSAELPGRELRVVSGERN